MLPACRLNGAGDSKSFRDPARSFRSLGCRAFRGFSLMQVILMVIQVVLTLVVGLVFGLPYLFLICLFAACVCRSHSSAPLWLWLRRSSSPPLSFPAQLSGRRCALCRTGGHHASRHASTDEENFWGASNRHHRLRLIGAQWRDLGSVFGLPVAQLSRSWPANVINVQAFKKSRVLTSARSPPRSSGLPGGYPGRGPGRGGRPS